MNIKPMDEHVKNRFHRVTELLKFWLLNLAVHPVEYSSAMLKTMKIRLLCRHFGGFSDNNILYANGVKIWNYRRVSIGERVSFGGNVHLMAYDDITIGDDCMFAYGVIVATATHDHRVPIMNKSYLTKPVVIGSNVWCGLNSIILPGVTIHDGVVVGAGTVVTEDIPMNAIVTGPPARVDRFRKQAGGKEKPYPTGSQNSGEFA